jgi:hypothetical protein
MSYINNPGTGGGSSGLNSGTIDVVLPAKYDEITGVVTGLSAAPLKVIGQVLYEEGVVVQSGINYLFVPTQLNSNGFNWKLKVLDNEYWPGPSSITIKVNYVWSSI